MTSVPILDTAAAVDAVWKRSFFGVHDEHKGHPPPLLGVVTNSFDNGNSRTKDHFPPKAQEQTRLSLPLTNVVLDSANPAKRYHEFPNKEFAVDKLKSSSKVYTTAFEESHVILSNRHPTNDTAANYNHQHHLNDKDSWYVPRKTCIKHNPSNRDRGHDGSGGGDASSSSFGCCAETVAISLHQDDRHIINAVDSLDLADLALEMPWNHYQRRLDYQLPFFATTVNGGADPTSRIQDDEARFRHAQRAYFRAIAPCLQPGTIFHIDNHPSLLTEFFQQWMPHISVPIVILTTESDSDSPLLFANQLQSNKNKLLVKWYGQSPLVSKLFKKKKKEQQQQQMSNHPDGDKSNITTTKNPQQLTALEKLVGFPLGLSKWHDQSRYLGRYLELRNYTNPFSDDNKERWTQAAARNVLWQQDHNDKDNNHDDGDDDVVDDAFYDTVLIKFGLGPHTKKWRGPIWDHVCSGYHAYNNNTDNHHTNSSMRSSRPQRLRRRDHVSCQLHNVSNHELYQVASQYLFGLSPPGRGWDCYRTYELLLLGVIPIVTTRPGGSHGLFENLPVLQVDETVLLTSSRRQLLQRMYDYLQSNDFVQTDFGQGWQRLFLRYWRRHVLQVTGRDKDIVVRPDNGGGGSSRLEYYQAYRYYTIRHDQSRW
ncbi:hypothetical protein ACA910_011525 [Epithemia clementina (nom. ined.)]